MIISSLLLNKPSANAKRTKGDSLSSSTSSSQPLSYSVLRAGANVKIAVQAAAPASAAFHATEDKGGLFLSFPLRAVVSLAVLAKYVGSLVVAVERSEPIQLLLFWPPPVTSCGGPCLASGAVFWIVRILA